MSIEQAASAIRNATALLIGAGAGMGVDSGLPDFRGAEGFWKAYPSLYGRPFDAISNPTWFEKDPAFAWGFFGHRFHLYDSTTPHAGFGILHAWGSRMRDEYFVVTSNVDGHFQKAGFEPETVFEVHGRINRLQCSEPCCDRTFSTDGLQLDIDEANLRCRSELPECPVCGAVARPNILMFDDWKWVDRQSMMQMQEYHAWQSAIDKSSLVVVEIGAGTAIKTVRRSCEAIGGTLVRINPCDASGPAGTISLAMPGLQALQAIDALIES